METELKLLLSAPELPRLLAHLLLAGTDLSEPLLELELELLSGPEDALMALADVLRQTPQGPVMLVPCDASKAQRGQALWQQK